MHPGMEKLSQDMLFEWAEKDPQPTVAKLCAALEAADLSRLAQGVMDKVSKEKMPQRKPKKTRTSRKVDPGIKVPVSEETIPYRVMVYLKDNLGESWKDLAVCLKMPSPRIKTIEADAWQVGAFFSSLRCSRIAIITKFENLIVTINHNNCISRFLFFLGGRPDRAYCSFL